MSAWALDVRTVLVLWHADGKRVLLLRRAKTKKLFPGLITGIGGAVELGRGEEQNLTRACLRELEEETRIRKEDVREVRLRLSTILSRDEQQVVLLWFTGRLGAEPARMECTEGVLEFHEAGKLPVEEMVPTAREAIAFVVSLTDGDERAYNGVFDAELRLIVAGRH